MQSSLSPFASSSDDFSPARDEARSRALGIAVAAYAALTACYLAAACGVAATRSLWMDEILAVWAARLPSAAQVVDAIWHGSEFSPPTYDLLLHALFQLFGYSKLVARLPSIVAILVAAAAMARIVTRRLDVPLGVLVFGLVLGSILFDYAIQARPYALMIACQAAALVLWSETPERGARAWRGVAIAILLALGVALHVYGIVGLVVLGLMETLWSVRQRRLRATVWIALAVAGLSSLAWLPLFRHLATFNAGDSASPGFYARPSWHVFQVAFVELSPRTVVLLATTALVLIAFACAVWRKPKREATTHDLVDMAAALLAALPIAFALSLFVTHAFSTRYALPAALGFALALALVARCFPYHRAVCLAMVPLLCLIHPGASGADETVDTLDVAAAAPGEGPIVVGEGLLFLQLMEAAPPVVRKRLVFLTAPPGTRSPDPTNEHQILRLQTFLKDLPVKGSLAFIADHPRFLELTRAPATADDIKPWIAAEHWKTEVVLRRPGGLIVEVEASPPHARDP